MNSSPSRRDSRRSSARRDSASATTRRKSLTAKLSEKLNEAALFLSARSSDRMDRTACGSSLSNSRRQTAAEPNAFEASRLARDGSGIAQPAPSASSDDSFNSSSTACSSHCGHRHTSASQQQQQPLAPDSGRQTVPVMSPFAISSSPSNPLAGHPVYHRLRDINRCV